MKNLFSLVGALLGVSIMGTGVTMLCLFNGSITYEAKAEDSAIVQVVGTAGANVYFIKADPGYVMVDTGMPCDKKDVDEIFRKIDVKPTNIKLIILTHGHMDNMALLGYAKKITGAKVLAHQSLAETLKNGEMEPAVAQNNIGVFLNTMNSFKVFIGKGNIEPVEPDILIENEFDLNEYGLNGKVISTPGHTAGSVSIVLDDGETLIGDLLTDEGKREIGAGVFYENKQDLIGSLKKVASKEPRIIYLSHGDWISNDKLKLAAEILKDKWAEEL